MEENNGKAKRGNGGWYDKIFSSWFEKIILGIFLPIAILLVGRYVAQINFETIAKGAIFICIVMVISSILGAVTATFTLHKDIHPVLLTTNNVLDNLKQEVNLFKHKIVSSLSTNRYFDEIILLEHEKTFKCRYIWIITRDLFKDAPRFDNGISFRDVVRYNIVERKIHYNYIVPKNHVVDERLNDIEQEYRMYSDDVRQRLQFVRLENDKWNSIPFIDHDFAIFNPTYDKGDDKDHYQSMEVYYELRTEGRYQWAQMDPSLSYSFVGCIKHIIQ